MAGFMKFGLDSGKGFKSLSVDQPFESALAGLGLFQGVEGA